MTPERQKKIDDLHRRSNRVLEVVMGALLLLGATVLLKPLLAALGFDMEDYAWFAIIKAIYKYTGIILGILTILAICTTGVLSYLATDEEKEQRKEEIKEAVREIKEEEENAAKTRRRTEATEVECPLIEVNDKQREAIIQLLRRRIPKHEKDNSRFDRSVVYTYLRALRFVHIIEPVKSPEDIDARRMWIEQITGLYEPQDQWAHFRGDYDEFKRSSKVSAAVKEIESELEKFR